MGNKKNGAGSDNEMLENGEEMTVTLTLDDGTELECVVLTIFEAGGRDYIALLPLDGREAEDVEVYLYRYLEDAEGNPDLANIEDDDEYEIVADAFDELLDTEEYDELVAEEDLDDLEYREAGNPEKEGLPSKKISGCPAGKFAPFLEQDSRRAAVFCDMKRIAA